MLTESYNSNQFLKSSIYSYHSLYVYLFMVRKGGVGAEGGG